MLVIRFTENFNVEMICVACLEDWKRLTGKKCFALKKIDLLNNAITSLILECAKAYILNKEVIVGPDTKPCYTNELSTLKI